MADCCAAAVGNPGEWIGSRVGKTMDPLAPAEVIAGLVFSMLLEPGRAARLALQVSVCVAFLCREACAAVPPPPFVRPCYSINTAWGPIGQADYDPALPTLEQVLAACSDAVLGTETTPITQGLTDPKQQSTARELGAPFSTIERGTTRHGLPM